MDTKNNLTGYPSIDKPWLKYYSEEHINAPLPNLTVYEYLKKQNANRLDYLAIDSEVGNYTYRELFSEINATAASLWKLGIQKGKIILSMFPVLPHESFLFYGVDAVGAAICQIAPQYTTEEVCNSANRIDASLLFISDLLFSPEMEQSIYSKTNIEHIIVVSFGSLNHHDFRTMSWDSFIKLGDNIALPEINKDPSDLLFLASTGGSTGEPKCVMYSSNSFNIAVHQYIQSPCLYQSKHKWLRMWPIFSGAASVANHHMPLCVGMVSVLRNFKSSITEFPEILMSTKPNHLILIPQIFEVMLQSKLLESQDLSFILSAGCGGMSITPQFEKRIKDFFTTHNIDCFVGYGWGCTESATIGAFRTSHETSCVGSVGVPFVKSIVSAFDMETGLECAYGQEGELCISSNGMMLGYYNAPDDTEKVLRTHGDGKKWLHTGDLGSVDENGFVRISGRMTRMILISPNAKIYPTAIENDISKISGVHQVAFCAIPNRENNGFFIPVCFVIPENINNAENVYQAVKQFCIMKYAKDSCPKQIFIIKEFPLTKVGKTDYRALEKMAEEMQ